MTPAEDFLFKDILCAEGLITKRPFTKPTSSGDHEAIPRWRLAREGPFPNERSRASLRVLGKGCSYRHTTYSAEDHAMPEGGLGVPLNHPRFLEWLGVPDSAWLLEMSPGHWCDTLTRDQAMSAAMQLHRTHVSCKRIWTFSASIRWHYTARHRKCCKRQLGAALTQERKWQSQHWANTHVEPRCKWRPWDSGDLRLILCGSRRHELNLDREAYVVKTIYDNSGTIIFIRYGFDWSGI